MDGQIILFVGVISPRSQSKRPYGGESETVGCNYSLTGLFKEGYVYGNDFTTSNDSNSKKIIKVVSGQ